ncbi:MAG: permease [Phenylobacterium sp. RIFCSPHIGHO2_01_FULL_69_31]|uniref:SLC13 family permease n=1 Tax=Phenylobacterium sp. RIFCSPHIGHO2_01_FULL_69_31 TaxID=1801944 RepID=UPI0008D08131|nr:SLC13 family permease [Phenylobacterium sp. RIFCSPHIGHO2_01_FULL_69_31]OHB30487.1 MAG: permease [Phenylobacterium sp. RIFCSPHIGHO2_01_FULL_69_31]
MTLQQALAFGLMGATIVAFIWGRWRYDVIAVLALLVGVTLNIVPASSAFDGFKNDITVIIACALIVSAAFAKSGVVELVLRPLLPHLKSATSQVMLFAGAVTILSMVTKNVGALAIMMPIALSVAKRTGTSPSRLLMPMSFGALLGGTVTLVGTSPNIIVSQVRDDILGRPFEMYDYAPVGLGVTAVGLVFLAFGYRLLPWSRPVPEAMEAALAANPYVTEVEVPGHWDTARTSVGKLGRLANGDVQVMALLRDGKRQASPHPNTRIRPGDILLLEGDHQALDDLIARLKLRLTRADRPIAMEEPTEEVRIVEAIVGPDSMMVGRSARQEDLHTTHGVNLLAVSRAGYRVTSALRTLRLRAGDVVVLQGAERALPGVLKTLGLLPLAEREVRLGGIRHAVAPALILGVAMVLVALKIAPVAIAFFGAAALMVAIGAIRMREAYTALDGPLLVLIACLIPVSDAIRTTGGADLIAHTLADVFRGQAPILALAAVMAVAMAATPFLNNAATVLIVAPIGASLARLLGLQPDPFLMAVALGAACDFLTPIGHQCNTLVMAPGGYRFIDYPRLGAPLTLIVLVVGTALIALVWPLTR